MHWEKPSFVIIDMNAEIGAYQADYENENPDRVRSHEQGIEVERSEAHHAEKR